MKEIIVGVKEIHYAYYKVWAEDEKEAVEKVNEELETGCEDGVDFFSSDYSHTCDSDEWLIDGVTIDEE
jgi:hypothetical protein